MADEGTPKVQETALDLLLDFLQGPEEDVREVPIETVREDLNRRGIDPAPLVRMIRERLGAAHAREALARARAEREKIQRLLAERVQKQYAGEDLRQRVLEILGSNPALAPAYRKFESAPEADIESLLDDLDFLEGIEDTDG